jgi:purine-cytosine permease-like protein
MPKFSIERIGKETIAATAAILIVGIMVQLVMMLFGIPIFEKLKEIWVIVLIIVISIPLYLGFRKGV